MGRSRGTKTPEPEPPATPRAAPWRGFLLRLGLTVSAAALLVLATPKLSLWPLAFVGFVPALFALRDRRGLAALGWGWLLGVLWNFTVHFGAVDVLPRFGQMARWTSVLVLLAVSVYQGLALGLWAWATRAVATRTRVPLPFVAAAALVVAELCIPHLRPWTWAVVAMPFWPATQSAELFGAASVTVLLMLVNATIFVVVEALVGRRPLPWRVLLPAAAVIVVALGHGLIRGWHLQGVTARSPSLRVGMVQPNFGITTKKLRAARWPEMVDSLWRLSAQAEREGAQLVVWPESAWPLPVDRSLVNDYPEGHPWQLRRGLKGALLAGVLGLDYSEERQPMFNSAWLLGPDGRGHGRYDKVNLMPFGEFVPLGAQYPDWRKSVRERMTESDELNRGFVPVTLAVGQARIAPLICYEDILPEYVRRYAAQRPNLLVTVSNLAWFGDSGELDQQLGLAALRAIELRHELLRATNTGVTAHIDALGRVRARGQVVDPPRASLGGTPAVLTVDARLVDRGRTLYTYVGDLFSYLSLAFLALLLLGGLLRRPQWLLPAD